MASPPLICADTCVVFDFETTGLSPDLGDRSIEIGAVRIERGEISAHFSALMNPGIRIPRFVENLTGISNTMIAGAPQNRQVMNEFYEFSRGFNLVAHNASFDARFLRAELKRIKKNHLGAIGCSLLSARRIFPLAENHRLATLAEYRRLPVTGDYHRALADAEVTAHLWLDLIRELADTQQLKVVPFELMLELGKTPRHQLAAFYRRWRAQLDTGSELSGVGAPSA